jgi:hypothetical protein
MIFDTSVPKRIRPPRRGCKIRAHDWLSLAAAPSFALLALQNQNQRGEMPAFCAALQAGSPLTGMVPMYLLMSIVHMTPWLKLLARRRRRGEGSRSAVI